GANPAMTVLDAGSDEPVVAYPDELLIEAVSRMLKNDIGRLPVVAREKPHILVGYLGRAAVMSATLRRYEEDHVREGGWLSSVSIGI
ncbi:MAG TPA: CBS domain-containing protein, partial [Acidobacteriota bacterium]|nr:CBS domain-containing protein [Acidobacteriota bacterium]